MGWLCLLTKVHSSCEGGFSGSQAWIITCCLPLWLRCGWNPLTPIFSSGPFAIPCSFYMPCPVSYIQFLYKPTSQTIQLKPSSFCWKPEWCHGSPLDSLGIYKYFYSLWNSPRTNTDGLVAIQLNRLKWGGHLFLANFHALNGNLHNITSPS